MIKYLPSGENLLNIGQVDPEIIRLKEVFNEAMHADDRLSKLSSDGPRKLSTDPRNV